MKNHDDELVNPGYDPDEMRAWATTGPGGNLAGKAAEGGAPVELLPPASAPVMVVKTVRFPFEVITALEVTAAARGVSVSDLIRDGVDRVLTDEPAAADPVRDLRTSLARAAKAADQIAAQHPEAA